MTFAMFCHLLFASIVQYIIIPSHTLSLSNCFALLKNIRSTGPMIPFPFVIFLTKRRDATWQIQTNMAASSSTAMPPSIPVIFTTKTPYQLPPQKFMIPASWRRFQLSQLINTALALPRVVPFDFLIRGVLLGGSLSETANGEVSQSSSLARRPGRYK